MKILIVDDEKKIADLMAKCLRDEKFIVDVCYDGEKAIESVLFNKYDIILLNYLLPNKNGKQVIDQIKCNNKQSKVIMLTDNIKDKSELLTLGVDDYIFKPFDFEELISRVRFQVKLLTYKTSYVLKAGDIILNSQNHVVTVAEEPINLSSKEFDLLEYLMQNKNTLVPRTKLWEHVWKNSNNNTYSNVIDVYICYLRNKINDKNKSKILIQSIRGKGYILRCED